VVVRVALFGLFRFHVDAQGRELLGPLGKRGGYLLVGAIHRGWMDPLLVLHALPAQPRPWFLGSGASAFDRPWKEWLLRRLGGILPVWRGGVGVEQHLASARAVLSAGGVFVLFPEGGIAGPAEDISTFRLGAALIAVRTGVPVVPFVMAGSDQLYVGRRMATRLLAPTSARELLGESAAWTPPEPGTRAELEVARRLTTRFEELLGPEVRGLAPALADPPGRRRFGRGLTWLLVSRRGPGPGTDQVGPR
jgi:1-acyl-sn-glycerol-3-phosphate acyltransferase